MRVHPDSIEINDLERRALAAYTGADGKADRKLVRNWQQIAWLDFMEKVVAAFQDEHPEEAAAIADAMAPAAEAPKTSDDLTPKTVLILRAKAAQAGDAWMEAICNIWLDEQDPPAFVRVAIVEALTDATAQRNGGAV